jgi:hypothetical protein
MLQTMDSRTPDLKRGMFVGAVVVGCYLLVNIVFYFLSHEFFSACADAAGVVDPNHCVKVLRVSDAELWSVRWQFATFAAVVSIGVILTGFAPWWFAHAVAGIAGVVSLVASVAAMSVGLPILMTAALAGTGAMFLVMGWHSLHRSRSAWAFLFSLTLITAVAGVFGAPKLRDTAGVSLWTAMMVPGLLACVAVALGLCRDQFRGSAS